MIADRNYWIIQKDNEYLMGYSEIMGRLIYTIYSWDAVRIRNLRAAINVANRIGGKAVRFNSLIGIKRE